MMKRTNWPPISQGKGVKKNYVLSYIVEYKYFKIHIGFLFVHTLQLKTQTKGTHCYLLNEDSSHEILPERITNHKENL